MTREMPQQLRKLAALAQDKSSVPRKPWEIHDHTACV